MTYDRSMTKMKDIAKRIAYITSDAVFLNEQTEGVPTTTSTGYSATPVFGTFVNITYISGGRKRCRTRLYSSKVELLIYLAQTFGQTRCRLSYTRNASEPPFYFQVYEKGVIQDD